MTKPTRLPLTHRKLMVVLSGSFVLIFSLSLACKQKIRGFQESGKTIYLDARSDWQSTGLRVKNGQKVRLISRGTWAVAPKNESRRWPDTGPEGHGNHPGEKIHRRGDSKKELPGVPFGALLGKVSDVVFHIGDQKEIVIPLEGELSLVINDYPFYRHDNRGGLTVTIVPQR